jgi:hypothetical protein
VEIAGIPSADINDSVILGVDTPLDIQAGAALRYAGKLLGTKVIQTIYLQT